MSTPNYQVSAETWQAIVGEVNRLLPRIQNHEEVTPEDVKEVRRLVKLVDSSASEYNKALRATYKVYKDQLTQQLTRIGYGQIEQYIADCRKKHQEQVSKRLTYKVDTFNQYVCQALATTQWLQQTSFATMIPNQLLNLFPKVNSGALTKEITDWTPIVTVVQTLITDAEKTMNPLYAQLPVQSHVAQTYARYFQTGDREVLTRLDQALHQDQEWLLNHHIAEKMETEADVLDMIEGCLKTRSDQTLSQIRQLLAIWDSKPLS